MRVGLAPVAPVGAVRLGGFRGAKDLDIDVVLRPRDPGGLARFATAVSTPRSSLYRDYLARGRFASVFGPTESTVRSVVDALRALGLRPGAISSNHLAVAVRAPASVISRAFAISFARYRLGDGRVGYTNTVPPWIPADVVPAVQGILGLQTLYRSHPLGLSRVLHPRSRPALRHVLTGGPQPCVAASVAGPANDSYTADQMASAYGFSGLYGAGDLGAGVTVAVFELEPSLASDIGAYQSCYGTSAPVTYTPVDGGAGTGAGSGEAALDIENVIGLAPRASIDVYDGPNFGTGSYDTYNAIVSADTARVISTSWGACESSQGSATITAESTLFQQAAAQGQTVVAAAGDSGSEDCGSNSLAVDDPASQPFVTGVGGTSITALTTPPAQVVWNDTASGAGAGGGGVSESWPMPAYQAKAPASLDVVNAHSSALPCSAPALSYCREVPDVSADADPYSAYVVYFNGAWGGIGGTSGASPLWAALLQGVGQSTAS